MSVSAHLQSVHPIADLVITVSALGTATIVELRGEADVATLPRVVATLGRVIADHDGDVVIDLAETQFIDTGTLRAILGARDALARDGRQLTIRSPVSRVAGRVLAVFGLAGLVTPLETACG